MLLKGGNAFDAAVAVGAMAALGEPEMNGIGGNGFMTIFDKKTGKVHSLSMAGAAPKALKPAEMTPETLNAGMKAGIVPGNLGGYLSSLDRFGTMSLAEVFAPAIEYAEKGYPIDPMLAQSIDRGQEQPGEVSDDAKIFLPERPAAQGRRAAEESRLRRDAAQAGRGRAAGASEERDALGGDQGRVRSLLQGRHRAGVRALLQGERRRADRGGPRRLRAAVDRAAAHDAIAATTSTAIPSTSRGGFEVLMQANLVERFDLTSFGSGIAAGAARVIEAIKVAKADIYRYVADPKFTVMPTAGMLSKQYAAARRGADRPVEGRPLSGRRARPRAAPPTSRRPPGRRDRPFQNATTASSTRRASRSSTSSATPSASRRRSAASSATTSSSATPGCC